MQQGGWDMWLLLLISVLGLAVVIERLVFFQMQHGDTKGLLRQIGTKVSADDLDGAIAVCKKTRGMLPRILEFGLAAARRTRRHPRRALDRADGASQLARANLAIIGTIAVIAPFVGLFGTVLGIIRAFQESR